MCIVNLRDEGGCPSFAKHFTADPFLRFIIDSHRANQCFAKQSLRSPALADVDMLDNLLALPKGKMKYSTYTQIVDFLPSIPQCVPPSRPFFLPSLLCGQAEGAPRILRVATLDCWEHQRAIHNYPLALGLRSVCSLNLS